MKKLTNMGEINSKSRPQASERVTQRLPAQVLRRKTQSALKA